VPGAEGCVHRENERQIVEWRRGEDVFAEANTVAGM
jgi:hypothetical protein